MLNIWILLMNNDCVDHIFVAWLNKFWWLVSIYLKSLFLKFHVKKFKTHYGGSKKKIFFLFAICWWKQHSNVFFVEYMSKMTRSKWMTILKSHKNFWNFNIGKLFLICWISKIKPHILLVRFHTKFSRI